MRKLLRRRNRRREADHVCVIDFEAPGGRRWSAIGGGKTFADAVAFARESLPLGAEWRPVASAPLYGN
jgi:hypothetical protein